MNETLLLEFGLGKVNIKKKIPLLVLFDVGKKVTLELVVMILIL